MGKNTTSSETKPAATPSTNPSVPSKPSPPKMETVQGSVDRQDSRPLRGSLNGSTRSKVRAE